MAPSVLITGTSTGIGAACAARLAAAGWTVFAGVRREEDGGRLVAEVTGDIRPVLLDVADDARIDRAVAEVAEAVGPAGLNGLVNNAGIGLGGPVELVPLEDWRRTFEVNLFGAVALTRAAFGLVRSAGGRFVFIGSDSGRISTPGTAPYSASKHALEALCESLRHELSTTPMRVSLVEPGQVATAIWDKVTDEITRVEALLDEDRRRDYGFLVPATRAFTEQGMSNGIPADRVAVKVEHALTASRPRARYLVGPDARLGGVVARLPDPARDRIVAAVVRWLVRRGSSSDAASTLEERGGHRVGR